MSDGSMDEEVERAQLTESVLSSEGIRNRGDAYTDGSSSDVDCVPVITEGERSARGED